MTLHAHALSPVFTERGSDCSACFREMKSIVKGLVSQDMEKIAKENKNNSGGLEIATVFCEQTTWPSKTVT